MSVVRSLLVSKVTVVTVWDWHRVVLLQNCEDLVRDKHTRRVVYCIEWLYFRPGAVCQCLLTLHESRVVSATCSLYGAHDSKLGNCTDIVNGRQPYVTRRAAAVWRRGRVTDRALTMTVRALWQPSGLWETTPDPRMTLTGEDAKAAGSERRGCSVRCGGSEQWDGSKRRGSSGQRGRRATCPSTPPLSRRSSYRANSLSAQSLMQTMTHSALFAVLCRCSTLGDCFSSLCSSPFCVNSF